jgi:hypothetical protein
MIVVFGGRKGSGKTLFSSELEKDGFIKISFADYLRETLSKLYKIDISKFKDPNEKGKILEKPLDWNKDVAKKLFKLVKISNYRFKIEDQRFSTLRQTMQYIGTNVLRRYNNNFHVEKTIKRIKKNVNYVCDDVRFPNELNALRKLKALDIFILRPNHFDISNHKSETSLKWNDFSYKIFNNKNIVSLKKDFNKMMKDYYDYIKNGPPAFGPSFPDNYHSDLFEDDFKFLIFDDDTSYASALFLANSKIIFNKNGFFEKLIFSTKSAANYVYFKKLFSSDVVEYKKGNLFIIEISSPFTVENLKLWNVYPNKLKYPELIDDIKNNESIKRSWFKGVADSDMKFNFS